jgi:hypothetical protein
MTGDWVFDTCIITALSSVLGLGTLIGYAIGNHMGLRKVKQELLRNGWSHNGWQYVEQGKR